MNLKNKKVIYLLLLLFGLYILSGMILTRRQDKLIFNPQKLDSNFVFQTTFKQKEFNLKISSVSSLNVLYLQTENANGQILYFHGRSGNINTYLPRLDTFLKAKKNIFIIDYPGYGKSIGKPTEKSVNESAKILYKLAINYMSADSTIIYGSGLGAAAAAYLATKRSCKKLVLSNPFYSLQEVAHHYFPIYPIKKYLHYTFPVHYYIQRVKAPVELIYHKKSKGFYYTQALKLSKLLFKKDTFQVHVNR